MKIAINVLKERAPLAGSDDKINWRARVIRKN
jgi:hypothetical protein